MVLILSVMTFAACTGNSESEESSVQVGSEESAAAETQMDNGTVDNMESSGITFPLEETMTFTGFAGMYGDVVLSDNYTWQTILERANIQIELTNVLGSELTEKRNLTLSGGSYPDIFYKSNFSSTDVETYKQKHLWWFMLRKDIKKNWILYLMILPVLLYFIIYHYWPMYGIQLAFKDYNAKAGIWGSEWVGLDHFRRFFRHTTLRT